MINMTPEPSTRLIARAIDEFGRLRSVKLKREQKAGDEIGDLARSISTMLSSLQRYTSFLERMPRTLRHEIHNPLNNLSTSLENLAEEVQGAKDSKYLASARRGVARIGFILQGLADAASLEESLKSEEPETCDLAVLLTSYVKNCRLNHPNRTFHLYGHGHLYSWSRKGGGGNDFKTQFVSATLDTWLSSE